MAKPQWQLKTPINAIILDCDGTLSRLEGIDELARVNGVGDEVSELTALAMSEKGVTHELYHKRLSLVQPNRHQVEVLGREYYDTRSPDVDAVIAIFQRLGKAVYVMSAGINPAVTIFAKLLNIPKSHVFAVDIQFDGQGNYVSFDVNSPLVDRGGKLKLARLLRQKHATLMHVGDGMNDVDAKEAVTRFVGYGGVFYRESIEKQCDFYSRSSSFAPLLALALTEEESKKLSLEDRKTYDAGVALIESGHVTLPLQIVSGDNSD